MTAVTSFFEKRKHAKRTIRAVDDDLDDVERTLADAIRDFRPRHFSAEDLENEITGSRRVPGFDRDHEPTRR